MKLLLFATALIIVAYAAAKPQGHVRRLLPAKNLGLAKRVETKTQNGYQLTYGCDRRHTYLDDGKCWSYCGASWSGGEWCYTKRADGFTKGCKNDRGCYHFVDKCAGACTFGASPE